MDVRDDRTGVPAPEAFSAELEEWLEADDDKTLGALVDVFEERSFALAFLVLMFPSALPLPTGGVTNLLEVVCVVFAVQMALGRRTVWLPSRLRRRSLGAATEEKAIPFIVRRVRWFERWSKPRLAHALDHTVARCVIGLVVVVFTVGAFVAPPFSGLDTLPSLGVVVLALGLLLHDVVLVIVGAIIGTVGLGLIVALGSLVLELFR